MRLGRRKFLAGALAAPAIIKPDSSWAQFVSGGLFNNGQATQSGGGGGGGTLILDQLTSVTPLAVYSTRKLLAAYAGNAMHVTASGGGSSGNIGFDGSGNLDASALSGIVNGTVDTWYDQSGNGYNATANGANALPVIRTSSTTALLGTQAALSTPTANNSLVMPNTSLSTPAAVTIAFCFKLDALAAGAPFTDGNTSNWRYLIQEDAGGTQYQAYNFGATATGGALDTTTIHTLVATFDNAGTALGNLYVDNVLTIASFAINASSFLDGQIIFGTQSGASAADMHCGEMLFFSGATVMSSGDRAIYHSTATGGQSCVTYWGSN